MNYLIEYFNNHKYELVCTCTRVIGRLIGIVDDGEDYYYLLYTDNGGFSLFSCAVQLITLKEYLPIEKYLLLEDIDFSIENLEELKGQALENLGVENKLITEW